MSIFIGKPIDLIFRFLTYVQPTHYFALASEDGAYVFPKVMDLPEDIKSQLEEDFLYSTKVSREYDMSWQAVQKGYMGEGKTYKNVEKLPLQDEYRFIRKYFNPLWATYILVLRLSGIKSPLNEIKAWRKSKNTQRSTYLDKPIAYPTWENYDSSLQKEQPLISVVIPTLNRYTYLKDVLEDFEKQTYTNFELIVVDQSEPFRKEFYDSFRLNIHLIHQEEKALWLARNSAIRAAKGTFIALSEDDVRVSPNWLEQHLKCIDFFKADISAGVFFPEGASIPKERSFFARAQQFATGNALIYRTVYNEIGLFDRQFEKQRMGDGEFGLRCHIAGFKSVSNPFASCIDVKAPFGGLRQLGSWDAFRPKKWFSPRPIPSVIYLFRNYYGHHRTRLSLLKSVPSSIMPYRFKRNKKMLLLGALISIFMFPLVLIQVCRSWYLAGKMIRQGNKIEMLEL